ncbi:unnamed protein product [Arabis nemorensis]|uniref:Uncharacterized protein n=1 Tax=Arabis nemorensis TaxID=586526 RepID=A0A565BNV3_9BRAS|nr:unnamed protein product [Arabis nemorensis]
MKLTKQNGFHHPWLGRIECPTDQVSRGRFPSQTTITPQENNTLQIEIQHGSRLRGSGLLPVQGLCATWISPRVSHKPKPHTGRGSRQRGKLRIDGSVSRLLARFGERHGSATAQLGDNQAFYESGSNRGSN